MPFVNTSPFARPVRFDCAAGFSAGGGVAPAIAELTGVMSDDEVAHWFAQPNAWLNGTAPAQKLLTDVPAVLDAARAMRFAVKG